MKMNMIVPAMALMLLVMNSAEAGWLRGGCKPAGCCETVACAPCKMVCCPEVKMKKFDKHCWKVECEQICVPRVKCPLFSCFQKKDCGDHCDRGNLFGRCFSGLCADVKTVRKLKKETYECEKCVVEWSVRPIDGDSCDSGCLKPNYRCAAPNGCAQIR